MLRSRKVIDRTIKDWFRAKAEELWPGKVERIILAGSRARGTNRPDSDWDVYVVGTKMRPMFSGGPIWRHREHLVAPDGNKVTMFDIQPGDLARNDLRAIADLNAFGVDLWP
jgi:predicted nucleotidyltransferase